MTARAHGIFPMSEVDISVNFRNSDFEMLVDMICRSIGLRAMISIRKKRTGKVLGNGACTSKNRGHAYLKKFSTLFVRHRLICQSQK